MKKIEVYDTTLRDGTQSIDINLSRSKKIDFMRRLVRAGVDYVELGWPGSNEEDMQVFLNAAKDPHKYTKKISAFGSVRRIKFHVEEDPNLQSIIESKARVVSIYGKTDLDHVKYQLGATPEQNLTAIGESVAYLRSHGLRVFYDAEHFFDGFKKSKDYALETLLAAYEAGAECLVLCDTKGGCLPWEIGEMILESKNYFGGKNPEWGIHTHNDAGNAVANALVAVKNGATHIQGTINGFGERAGNADLCALIPALMLKMNFTTNFNLKKLTEISRDFYVLAGLEPNHNAPYVGENAFAHKGGIHVDAMRKFKDQGLENAAYEHIDPHMVGNKRIYVLSELSGKSNVVEAAKHFDYEIDLNDRRIQGVLREVEEMRRKGYNIGSLEAEAFLLIDRHFGLHKKYFDVTSWSVETKQLEKLRSSTAVLTAFVRGKEDEASCTGVTIYDSIKSTENKRDYGPVSAIYKALTKILMKAYPHIFQKEQNVTLVDYNSKTVEYKGEDSSVRVEVEFQYKRKIGSGIRTKYGEYEWKTVGVSDNIIEASVEAIEKAFHYIIRRTDKSLTELLDESSSAQDIFGLAGENFEFDGDGIELLHRIGNNYRKKSKSRSRTIEVETFLAYLNRIIRKKVGREVRDAFMACAKAYERDPAFLHPEGKVSEELSDFFAGRLDAVYDKTKIGKYNRQFEYLAESMGTLYRRINGYIDLMGLDEETERKRERIAGSLDALCLMFKRYWKAHGANFYNRVEHWQGKWAYFTEQEYREFLEEFPVAGRVLESLVIKENGKVYVNHHQISENQKETLGKALDVILKHA